MPRHAPHVAVLSLGAAFGLSGAACFAFVFAAGTVALWGLVAAVMCVYGLAVELLRHHSRLLRCATLASLRLLQWLCGTTAAVATVFSGLHLCAAVALREPFPNTSNLARSDYILTIWTLLSLKYSAHALHLTSRARRQLKRELEESHEESRQIVTAGDSSDEESRHATVAPSPELEGCA